MRFKSMLVGVCLSGVLLGGNVAYAADTNKKDVLLTAGEVTITTDDMRHYIQERIDKGLPAERFAEPGTVPRLMENLMMVRVLANKARSEGVRVDEQMQWALDVERDRQLYNRYVHNTVAKQLAKTDWDALAKEEYLAYADQYKHSGQVSVSHILVAINKERNESQALERIKKVAERLAAGDDFARLVKEFSDDSGSLDSDGALGYFAPGKMVRSFSEAAFAMQEVGELSEPVKSNYGYHIIRLDGTRKAGKIPFAEVKGQIIAKLKKGVEADLRTELTQESRSPSEFELDHEKLKSLELEYVKGKSIKE